MHIDLNSFFASCEQQDKPELRGRPVGVVQDSGRRSLIIASSREAKMIGVGTATPLWQAKKIYPNIAVVPAHFERYIRYSRLLRQVCQYYTDQVELFSIDELFMDITRTQYLFGGPITIAKKIKNRLKVEVGSWFTISIGIAPNKMLAKLASGSEKPDGLVVVKPKKRLEFLDRHPLWHICGIAQRVQQRLNRLGIFTIRQMRQAPVKALVREFGVLGQVYSQWAHGQDHSPVLKLTEVEPEKSFGNQITLPYELADDDEIFRVFMNLSWQVAGRLREKGMGAKTVSLALHAGDELKQKVQADANFSLGVKGIPPPGWKKRQQLSLGRPCATAYDLYQAVKLIYRRMNWNKPVRFVSISASNLIALPLIPLSLLDEELKQERASSAWDKIARKYGTFFLRPAKLFGGRIKDVHLNGFSKRF